MALQHLHHDLEDLHLKSNKVLQGCCTLKIARGVESLNKHAKRPSCDATLDVPRSVDTPMLPITPSRVCAGPGSSAVHGHPLSLDQPATFASLMEVNIKETSNGLETLPSSSSSTTALAEEQLVGQIQTTSHYSPHQTFPYSPSHRLLYTYPPHRGQAPSLLHFLPPLLHYFGGS